MSVRGPGHGFLAEHPAGAQCTRAGKSAAALAAGTRSPAPRGAAFPARAASASVAEDCKPALSPWAAE